MKKNTIQYDRRTNTRIALIFLLPSTILFLLFSVWPLVYSLILSSQAGNIFTGGTKFVGIDNYLKLLSDQDFLNALKNTFIYTLGNVLPSLLIGYIIAVLLDVSFRGVNLYRSVVFAPLVTSMVAISAVWMWIYHPDYGVLNGILNSLGLGSQQWLTSSNTALFSLIIMGIWKNLSFCTVLFVGALQNVPADVLEAALIDGASDLKITFQIKFPLVSPTAILIAVMLTIQSFQTFTEVNVMTDGGPAKATELIVPLLYDQAFTYSNYGYSSAIAVVLFSLVLLLTLIQIRVSNRKVFYQ